LTAKSGIIKTPNYPDNYNANSDCYWEFIRPEDGSCVVFTVEDFNIDTDEPGLCPGDHFALESCGSWQDISPERYYCGDYTDIIDKRGSIELVQHYQINATSLRVSFHSDSTGEAGGFLMQYSIKNTKECKEYGSAVYNEYKGQDCLALMDGEQGTFNTVNYPQSYPADLACVYAFVRPSAEYCGVFLRATKFDLEEKDAGTCHDFFGVPGCRPKCGRADQPIIEFLEYQKGATVMPLQFSSDFSVQGRGFRYSYVQLTDCFNPYQAECPNDQLSLLAEPTECDLSIPSHECSSNDECDGGKICCFDGCLRKCVKPEKSVRRKREVAALEELLIDVNITTAGMFPNTIPNYKIRTKVDPSRIPFTSLPTPLF